MQLEIILIGSRLPIAIGGPFAIITWTTDTVTIVETADLCGSEVKMTNIDPAYTCSLRIA